MEFGASSNTKPEKVKKSEKSRRVWSQRDWGQREEDVLIQALKEAVTTGGWKSDNGLRCGYINFLEKLILKAFPKTDLRGSPHINSKIRMWKKIHVQLVTMLSKSGIGWNDTTKMIEATYEAWDSFVKIDSSMQTMRYKSWPYFPDWCEIFGYDRATRQKPQSFVEVVQHVLHIHEDVDNEMEVNMEDILHTMEGGDKSMLVTKENSVTKDTSFTVMGSQKSNSKKKKQPTQCEELFVEAINNFTSMTKEAISNLAKRISGDYEISLHVSKDVIDVLKGVPGLTKDERMLSAEILLEKPNKLALFLNLQDDEKIKFVRRLLKNE